MNHLFSLGFSPLISVPAQGGTRCSVSKRSCSYRMVLWDLLSIDSALYTEQLKVYWSLSHHRSLESLSKQRFCQHGRHPEVNRVVIDDE